MTFSEPPISTNLNVLALASSNFTLKSKTNDTDSMKDYLAF